MNLEWGTNIRNIAVAIACAGLLGACASQLDTGPGSLGPQPARAPRDSNDAEDGPADSDAGTSGAGATPVHLFYSVHVHGSGDWKPYTDQAMDEINSDEAEGLKDQVDAIASTLERHGARGSFHFVYGSAAGLCEPDSGTFVRGLIERGHEVGAHAHRDEDPARAMDALKEHCGIDAVTASGIMAMANTAKPGGGVGKKVITEDSLSVSMRKWQAVGIEQLLDNIAASCGAPDGIPQGTGNILHPWFPAFAADKPCDPADTEDLVNIDHASITELSTRGSGPADVVSSREFAHLLDLFETAPESAAASPELVSAWGFVTHTHEYAVGTDIASPPQASALDALDGFLAELDKYVEDGRAVWSTGAEIATLVRARR